MLGIIDVRLHALFLHGLFPFFSMVFLCIMYSKAEGVFHQR